MGNTVTTFEPGTRFGGWTVISYIGTKRSPCGKMEGFHQISCRCGFITEKRPGELRHILRGGPGQMCKSCSYTNRMKYETVNEISGKYLTRAQRGAMVRGISFDITMADLSSAWETQKGICTLSNIPLTLLGSSDEPSTASIDRIDSNLGYTRQNIQWVHKTVNKMKMELDEDKFISFCVSIATNRGGSS